MALHGGTTQKRAGQDITTGPSNNPLGDYPPNPADTLKTAVLPYRRTSQETLSRPFERKDQVNLYRREDPSASPEMYCEPLPEGEDPSKDKFGVDQNKYSKGPNQEFTENGGLIYGT